MIEYLNIVILTGRPDLKITLYGTRGSIPVSRPDVQQHGGNTTCLRVESAALPEGMALVVDAGSGYVPLCGDLLKEGIFNISLLFSHWHHDHTQGLCLAPHTFIPSARLNVWGPCEDDLGPEGVFRHLMRAPFFPVDFGFVQERFDCHNIKSCTDQVLICHPDVGLTSISQEMLEEMEQADVWTLGERDLPLDECLVIKMWRTNHPQMTISYRFEERSSGKVFVFLTDHENTDGYPTELLSHVSGADLLVQDCQYSRERYDTQTKGFGHGTPDYCAGLMVKGGCRKLGITHHDPGAHDEQVQDRVKETLTALRQLDTEASEEAVFACADLMCLAL
ncbi:MAG TPA: hypothetical protein DCE42_27940 [Myxococcales bacterium]|nr:hypothetical protein [Deltaproteobacteria bacterium]HAA58626.1 hypothetical protein [Myxococcales bacterium]|tara:strand:+ start:4779 stop:5783 length:1005 start_codon:yes stop_codon:yes gene_type:complete